MLPNRIIKESICYSDDISELSWFEECFFYRLIVSCDDYGRMDARAAILKSRLFPLKDVTVKQVENALSKLVTVGMVRVYEYDRQPYLQLLAWTKHQRPRDSKEKYPAPPDNDVSPQVAASCGESRPVSQSQAQSQSQAGIEANASCRARPTSGVIAEIVAFLNLTCGTSYKHTPKSTASHINARLNEGFTLDDFKTVILKKHADWSNDPERCKYLRPETLFGTKFESYLNQPDKPKAQSMNEIMSELYHEAKAREAEQSDPV